MYKYEYEELTYTFSGLGFGKGHIYEPEYEIKEIIEEKAKQGFRYIGFIPTKQRATGLIEKITLIFECKEK